jgi:hypothetical protein
LTNFLEEVSHRTRVYKGSAQEEKRDHQQQYPVHLHRRQHNESSRLFVLDLQGSKKEIFQGVTGGPPRSRDERSGFRWIVTVSVRKSARSALIDRRYNSAEVFDDRADRAPRQLISDFSFVPY